MDMEKEVAMDSASAMVAMVMDSASVMDMEEEIVAMEEEMAIVKKGSKFLHNIERFNEFEETNRSFVFAFYMLNIRMGISETKQKSSHIRLL